jgi:hypothetical protein
MVPETVTQVDDMLIPRSNSALFHKLLSAPERVSGTDRGGPPHLFKRSKDTYQNYHDSEPSSECRQSLVGEQHAPSPQCYT